MALVLYRTLLISHWGQDETSNNQSFTGHYDYC